MSIELPEGDPSSERISEMTDAWAGDDDAVVTVAPRIVVRRCFAYNIKAQRCTDIAGHDGDHSISMTWTDDECYDPSLGSSPAMVATEMAAPVFEYIQPDEPIPVEPCVACGHGFTAHGESGCTGKQGDGEPCACYSFI